MSALATQVSLDSRGHQVYGVLVEVARQRATILYGELGSRFGLEMRAQHHRATMATLLGEVADTSYSALGIVLPVLVVSKSDNLPSGRRDPENPSGFWGWVVLNGFDISDPYKLVVDEQRKVYNKLA